MVVVMTHNYLHDLELLRQLLPLPLRYLGCLDQSDGQNDYCSSSSTTTRSGPALHCIACTHPSVWTSAPKHPKRLRYRL